MDFHDRVILVTGASRGIGAAIARAFAAEGGRVAVNYLSNAEAAEAVAAECRELGGDGWPVRADVGDAGAVAAMFESVEAEFGRIDAVVNNAFLAYAFDPAARTPFWDLDWGDYERQFQGSLRGAFNVCRAAIPAFERRASGSIVNIATDLVERPSIPYHEYTTAKAALVGFSRNLAVELGPRGIRVNCVAPGLVYPTEGSRDTSEATMDRIAADTPLRRIAAPGDVAGPVLFLASDWSRFMTGQTLYVDGGLVMR